jgi:hypothetical protein
MPLIELYNSCKKGTSPYHIYENVLIEAGLFEKGRWRPNDSVRNIVLSFFKDDVALRNGEFSSQKLEIVKLRNGTEYNHDDVQKIMDGLNEIYKKNSSYISELYDSFKGERELDESTVKVLEASGLIDKHTQHPNASVRDVVLSSFDKESGKLRSPAMPLDELVKMALESLQEGPQERERQFQQQLKNLGKGPQERERQFQQQLKNLEVASMRLEKMKKHIANANRLEAVLDPVIMGEGSTLAEIENKIEGINQELEGLKEEYKKMREIHFKRRLEKGKEVLEEYVYPHQSYDYFSKENQPNQEASSSDHQKTLDLSSADSNLSQSERNLRTEESLRNLMYSEESKGAILVGPYAVMHLTHLCKNPNDRLEDQWVRDILTEKGFIDQTEQPSPAVRDLARDGTLDKLNKWAEEYFSSHMWDNLI